MRKNHEVLLMKIVKIAAAATAASAATSATTIISGLGMKLMKGTDKARLDCQKKVNYSETSLQGISGDRLYFSHRLKFLYSQYRNK